MFVKTLFLLILSILAFAQPQKNAAKAGAEGKETAAAAATTGKSDTPVVDVDALENRIAFVTFEQHTQAAEGEILTITVNPPSPEEVAAASQLVKYFTIAIGTGNGMQVDNEFFMESEPFQYPIATGFTYNFQLPAQMENKKYCIVYTPYDETGNKPMINGVPMESLYETWFPISGSLKEGTGPKTAVNTAQNAPVNQGTAAQGAQGAEGTQGVQGTEQNGAQAPGQTDSSSSSITISPAITAFIAVLFACFFI